MNVKELALGSNNSEILFWLGNVGNMDLKVIKNRIDLVKNTLAKRQEINEKTSLIRLRSL